MDLEKKVEKKAEKKTEKVKVKHLFELRRKQRNRDKFHVQYINGFKRAKSKINGLN